MRKYEQIRKVIEELYKDRQAHHLDEMREKCRECGIDIEADKNAVNNVVFKMKKENYLKNSERKGEYELVAGNKKAEEPVVKKPVKAAAQIDWNEFFVLKPETDRLNGMKISISEKGELRLNSRLQKEVGSQEIELIFSKNYKVVLLNPNGKNSHRFTKAGTVKNREIVELLRKLKISFPVIYSVNWDERYQMWKGQVNTESRK